MDRTRVRWGRLLGVALWGAASLGLASGRAGAGQGGLPPPPRYVVRSGDTLWGIAARLAGRTADPRPVVDRLVSLNRIRDGKIWPGQQLRLSP